MKCLQDGLIVLKNLSYLNVTTLETSFKVVLSNRSKYPVKLVTIREVV